MVVSVIWSCYDEQCPLPFGVLGPCIRERADMGLLLRSPRDLARVHRDGDLRQHPNHFSTMDISRSFPALSVLLGIRICPRLCLWLVLDHVLATQIIMKL